MAPQYHERHSLTVEVKRTRRFSRRRVVIGIGALVLLVALGGWCVSQMSKYNAQKPLREAVSALKSSQYVEALRLLSPFVEEGDPTALRLLGEMYALGHGVTKDRANATGLLRRIECGCGNPGRRTLDLALDHSFRQYGERKDLDEALQELPEEACDFWLAACIPKTQYMRWICAPKPTRPYTAMCPRNEDSSPPPFAWSSNAPSLVSVDWTPASDPNCKCVL